MSATRRTDGSAPTSWRDVGALALAGHLVAAQAFVTIPVGPVVAADWGAPDGSGGWPTAAFALGYAVASLLAGAAADRLGRRRLAVVAAASTALVGVLVSLAPGLGVLVVGRCLQGLCAGGVMPLVYAEVGERTTAAHRPAALATVSAAMASSVVLGQVVGDLLEAAAGWRVALLVPAVAPAVAAVLLRRHLLGTGAERPPVGGRSAAATWAAWPLALPTLLVAGLLTFVFTGIERLRGSADDLLGVRLLALVGVVCAVLLQRRAARVPAPVRARAALLGCAAAAVPLLVPGGTVPALVLLMAALSVLGPAVIEILADTSPVSRNRQLAAYGFVLNLGGAAGAAAGAHVGSAGALAGGVVAAVAVALAGLALGTGDRRRRGEPGHPASSVVRAGHRPR